MKTYIKHFWAIFVAVMIHFVAKGAQDDIVIIEGETTFFADATMSLNQAKALALEQARLFAIAEKFGTNLAQSIYHRETVSGGDESTYFNMLNSTQVNGQWLGDIGEPKFKVSFDDNDCYIIDCRVKGRARKLGNEATEFEAVVLRNGNEERMASTTFHPGDEMKLLVRVPVNGFMVVYMVCDDGNAYTLLPYANESSGFVELRRDVEYVFFDEKKADKFFGVADEIIMTLDDGKRTEANTLYIIFSPKAFSKAVDRSSDGVSPRRLEADKFYKWLSDIRVRDNQMGLKVITVSVEK